MSLSRLGTLHQKRIAVITIIIAIVAEEVEGAGRDFQIAWIVPEGRKIRERSKQTKMRIGKGGKEEAAKATDKKSLDLRRKKKYQAVN